MPALLFLVTAPRPAHSRETVWLSPTDPSCATRAGPAVRRPGPPPLLLSLPPGTLLLFCSPGPAPHTVQTRETPSPGDTRGHHEVRPALPYCPMGGPGLWSWAGPGLVQHHQHHQSTPHPAHNRELSLNIALHLTAITNTRPHATTLPHNK